MSAIGDASIARAVRWVRPLPMLGDRSPVMSQCGRPFEDRDPHHGTDLMFRDPTVGRAPPRYRLERDPLGDLDWTSLALVTDGIAAVALVGPRIIRALRKEGPSS